MQGVPGNAQNAAGLLQHGAQLHPLHVPDPATPALMLSLMVIRWLPSQLQAIWPTAPARVPPVIALGSSQPLLGQGRGCCSVMTKSKIVAGVFLVVHAQLYRMLVSQAASCSGCYLIIITAYLLNMHQALHSQTAQRGSRLAVFWRLWTWQTCSLRKVRPDWQYLAADIIVLDFNMEALHHQ